MNEPRAELPAAMAAPNSTGKSGSPLRWLILVALVLLAHLALIFIFGAKKPIVPRAATNAPQLQLANDNETFLALNNPTLFALPNAHDFASDLWRQMPVVPPPSLRYTEPPRWLPLAEKHLGATFSRFMATNIFAALPLDFQPPPKFSEPVLPIEPALPRQSTLRIFGALARRPLLAPPHLPSLPYNDVIAPSKIQVLVAPSGDVISAVVLPSDNFLEAAGRADIGDTTALKIAGALRFAPAPELTLGQLFFDWRTVPPPETNAPANP